MKVYQQTGLIVNSDASLFHQQLAEDISKMQDAKLTVEILYQPTGSKYSALILGYTEE